MAATYRKRGKSWLVTVCSGGERQFKTVRSEADAKALVREITRQEIAGVNVVETIRKARAAPVPPASDLPALRDALSDWIDQQVAASAIRASTAATYMRKCRGWLLEHALPDGRPVGDVPVNLVTREHLGQVITAIRAAGRSRATVSHVRNPLVGLFRHLVETGALPGPGPAADLKHFVGKNYRKKASSAPAFFSPEEGPALMVAAREVAPRFAAFVMTGVLAGLRWGESAGLFKTDIDWPRSRLHVQRTVSNGTGLEPCKGGRSRWVRLTPRLLDALREQVRRVEVEAEAGGWSPEARRLVFPNTVGRMATYQRWLTGTWGPIMAKSGLPYRKYHSTRHTFASWALDGGEDLRYVQRQLGHASISQTADTYGHLAPEQHGGVIDAMDRHLTA